MFVSKIITLTAASVLMIFSASCASSEKAEEKK